MSVEVNSVVLMGVAAEWLDREVPDTDSIPGEVAVGGSMVIESEDTVAEGVLDGESMK